MLKVYNTLSRKKEEFIPQNPPEVRMYVCGITPYDECHIGHARCYVIFDVIRRYLEYRGYKVHYVQNFTDIDDKIINKARNSQDSLLTSLPVKERVKKIAEKYIADYYTQMALLNIKPAHEYPRVTEHIQEIIDVIRGLINKEYAYVIDRGALPESGESVYFNVERFKDYGKLSHRTPEQMMPGARIEVDERKKSPLDFALWKGAKEDEPFWDSPWGKGRPGWHIECSVMSMNCLGSPTLDIHGGGQDLVFPHHENEIAQSEAYTGKPFVKYWIHNAFVTINKEKMSKSLGNFFTIREVLEKYEPMVVRLFLLSAHYRRPLDFSDKELDMARESYMRLCNFRRNVDFISEALLDRLDRREFFHESLEKKLEYRKEMDKSILDSLDGELHNFTEEFIEAMDDDFNTPKALGSIFNIVRTGNDFINRIPPGVLNPQDVYSSLNSLRAAFDQLMEVMGIKIETGLTSADISGMLEKREKARRNKDWATADSIRRELQEKGIMIEDTPFGPRLIVK